MEMGTGIIGFAGSAEVMRNLLVSQVQERGLGLAVGEAPRQE